MSQKGATLSQAIEGYTIHAYARRLSPNTVRSYEWAYHRLESSLGADRLGAVPVVGQHVSSPGRGGAGRGRARPSPSVRSGSRAGSSAPVRPPERRRPRGAGCLHLCRWGWKRKPAPVWGRWWLV